MLLLLLGHLQLYVLYKKLLLFGTECMLRLGGLLLLSNGLEVGRVHFPGLTVLNVLNATNEVIALQLEVHW